jgi:hypothetical protein
MKCWYCGKRIVWKNAPGIVKIVDREGKFHFAHMECKPELKPKPQLSKPPEAS